MTDAQKNFIKKHEGCRLTEYADTNGNYTIGWGHLCTAGEDYTSGITQDEADAIFNGDFETAQKDAEALCGNFDDLTEARQAVVLDMAFNLGYEKFSKFDGTLTCIENANYVGAARHMKDTPWFDEVGERGIEDCEVMISGNFK